MSRQEHEDLTPPENDDDIPVLVRRELMRCAVSNGRISYYYLCNVWRLGHDAGYSVGWGHGLDESAGDPRVQRIEAGFKAMHAATNGEYSREDMAVLDALQAGRDFAVGIARREEHIRQLIEERGVMSNELAAREAIIEKYEAQLVKVESVNRTQKLPVTDEGGETP